MRNPWLILVLVAAVTWHVFDVGSHWAVANKRKGASDFASYYYAVQTAADGQDPYDARNLRQTAKRGVHPFFYPPPFLVVMAWVGQLDLHDAYRVWFWLDELFALLVVGILATWWRQHGDLAPAVLAVLAAALTAIPNNHVMGQFNLPVLALVLAGLWVSERDDRPLSAGMGGVLVGTACMLKMSPAFLVLWWALRRRWVAVGAAVVGGVVWSGLALTLVPLATQVRFYTEILPGFSSGDYNGLAVEIHMFGNHSLPNLYDQISSVGGRSLSTTARTLSTVSMGAILGGLGIAFLSPPTDALQRHAQLGAVMAAMLLVPVYTYEHHMVWLLPGAVIAVVGVVRGRLGPMWGAAVAMALVAWCFDLMALKRIWAMWDGSWVAWVAQEVKFGALLTIFAACVRLGSTLPVSRPTGTSTTQGESA